MGTQRIRKKRRRRFRKPNPLIVILASITIILLFVWGGLYWKESSEEALIVPTNGKEQNQKAEIEGEKGSINANNEESSGMNSTLKEEPLIDEMGEPTVASEDTIEGGGISPTTKESEKNEDTFAKLDGKPDVKLEVQTPTERDTSLPTQPRTNSQLPTHPNTSTTTNSDSSTTTKMDSSTTVDVDSPRTTDETDSSSGKQVDVMVTPTEKYEQKMIQIEENCRKDMKVVLNSAEASIQKVNTRSIVAVQTWKENTTLEITTAESKCEVTYQELIRTAEKDVVSATVIEKWKQTYNTLKAGLQDESRAKMQRLMGG